MTAMAEIDFDRNFTIAPGCVYRESPLVRRVLCDNPGPFTFRGTSSFIVGHGEVALIDPGPDDERHLDALLAALPGERIAHILITHTHMDHSPLAARLKAASGATILASDRLSGARADTDLRLDASIDRGFVYDRAIADGEVIAGDGWTLEAVFTPGHLSNHMAYALHEEKALFCGDHVMAWATSVIAPPDGHMGDYFASLRKLLERDDEIYYPAHGPLRRNPLPLVRGYLAHRRMREEAIFNRIKSGDGTIDRIVAAIYADVDPRLHAAAALSTLAHIEHLIEQGRISSEHGRYVA
jgi:glyoxylase-like metal-dependent hydrolase (beta-lactamase superfamily II)